jgi:DHA2 family multidrug resistance protein
MSDEVEISRRWKPSVNPWLIAATGAIVTNRSLVHQARLQEAMRPGNPAFINQVNALTAYFGGTGEGPGPGHMARTAIYQQLNQQAAAQAYQDIYRLLGWMAIGMVACAFILSKNKPGQGAPAGEAMH